MWSMSSDYLKGAGLRMKRGNIKHTVHEFMWKEFTEKGFVYK